MRTSRQDDHGPGRAPTGRTLRDLLPWAPTLLGVFALVLLLIFAATRFSSSPQVSSVPPARPFLPVPELTTAVPPPGASVPASASPTRQVRPATVPTSPRPTLTSRRPTTAATTTPVPAPGPVSGRYRVVDSYADGFMGEVLVANSGGRDEDWRVELRFPAAVDDLVTSWVESAPQATLRRSGDSYIWSSGAPVPARGQVALRFHFSRSGSGNLPSTCRVNGVACAGVR
jgi:hypothetical protein